MRDPRPPIRRRHAPAWIALALLLSGCTLLDPASRTGDGTAGPETGGTATPAAGADGTGAPDESDGADAPGGDDAGSTDPRRVALLRPPGYEAEIERRRARLSKTAPEPLPAAEAGYYMDLQEANLRQHLGDTEVRITRHSDRIVVLLSGAPGFETGEVEPDPRMVRLLDTVAGVVAQYPATLVAVHAYTDPSGTAELNRRLSEQRALRVAGRLADGGIPTDHLVALGHGESRLATDDMAPEDRPPNRRIELHLQPVTMPVQTSAHEGAAGRSSASPVT